MTFTTQPLPRSNGIIVRLKQTGKPCHILGVIEQETSQFFKTVKTMQGFFIRERMKKTAVHTTRCGDCPSEALIERKWLQDGKDPNQPGLVPIR